MKAKEKEMDKKHYHFVGIGGIGMSALARLLLMKTHAVSGSDMQESPIIQELRRLGAKINIGHDASHIPSAHATVIYNSLIQESNPELAAAKDRGCTLLHRSHLLRELTQNQQAIAVTGTHGKTTTTALLSSVLRFSGNDPSFVVGGIVQELKTNSYLGKGNYFVLEADESDNSHLEVTPVWAIITNLEPEHLHYHKDFDHLVKSFQQFVLQLKNPNQFFWCYDCPHLRTLFQGKGVSYGFSLGADLKIDRYRSKTTRSCFDLHYQGKMYTDVQVNLIGQHNSLNAASVFAMALGLGIEENSVRKALLAFEGTQRRQEIKYHDNSLIIIDDYAHHPSEIRATLKAIYESYPNKRVIAVCQPHRYSRVRDSLYSFKEAFEYADEVIMTDLYPAGESPILGVSVDTILQLFEKKDTFQRPFYVPFDEIVTFLQQYVLPHDLIVFLGAGTISQKATDLASLGLKPSRRYRIGLVYGGKSSEHEIAQLSKKNIADHLDRNLYEVTEIYVDKQGDWRLSPEVVNHSQKIEPSILQALTACDVVFPVFHGPRGEDGMLQGFLDTLEIPYVGCDYQSSAFCMDKLITKLLVQSLGIEIAPFVDLSYAEWQESKQESLKKIVTQLRFPLFIKAVHLGSSLGIQMVHHADVLERGLKEAFLYDSHLIIEEKIEGREFEFAALGDLPRIFGPGEVLINGQFYDYSAKYEKNTPTIAQASLDFSEMQRGQEIAKKIFFRLRCSGLVRIDFFYTPEKQFIFNEANPIPGFTPISLYPQMCSIAGVSMFDVVSELISVALRRSKKNSLLKG